MQYNDTQICSDMESRIIKERFSKLHEKEVQDLSEIYEKLNEQVMRLSNSNTDHRYDSIIRPPQVALMKFIEY